MRSLLKSALKRRSVYPLPLLDRLLRAAPRHKAALLLLMVGCGASVVGAFVIRDFRAANGEAQEMYTGLVHGLQRIGELQYDTQETRRATLYALTTSDSNLQVEYADQSRDADQRVKDGIAEFGRQARLPEESALAAHLAHDWASYLSVRDEVVASILEGSIGEAVSLDLARGVPTFERVRQDLEEVKRLYAEDASRRQTSLAASSRRSSAKLIGILSFTFLFSCAAVWAIQRGRMLSTLQLAKLQMEFVASVSHELRTPLAVMSSAADNIADGLVEGKSALRKYGAILQHQSRDMGRLVDEILLFASTEDRKSRYKMQPLQVAAIMDSILAGADALVRPAGCMLDTYVEPGLPAVTGDLSGISQCLQNLIGNAVKYSGECRRIALRASAGRGEHGKERELLISVSDRGIGIESSELAHIFDPFFRSPSVRDAQIHGTGLGLSLAKRIAESMGGSLSVVSELSKGSTFTLHLQFAKGEDMQQAAQARRPIASSNS